jgi:fructose-specific component phosphotransferase system IIB-like protein
MKRLLTISVLLAAALSTGCASVSQAVDAYGAAVITGAKATNDSLIAANKVALCGTPVSALVRHPELVPAVRSLCLASSDTTTGGLLDAVEQAKPAPGQ